MSQCLTDTIFPAAPALVDKAPSSGLDGPSAWLRRGWACWRRGAVRRLAEEGGAALDAISRSYMELLLLKDGRIGLMFMAGTFLNPPVGAFGVLAVLSAHVFRRLIGTPGEPPAHGSYANPLLAGLAMGALLAPTWQAAAVVAVVGAVTWIVAVGLSQFFGGVLRLPVLTLPAVLCAMIASAAVWNYPELSLATAQSSAGMATAAGFPAPIEGFLRSLGAILFVPHPVAGLLFAGLLAWRSRIMLLLAVAGFAAAVGFRALLTGDGSAAALWPYNFNFMLVAMLLGGVLFVPSWTSYGVALLGAILAALLLDATCGWWLDGRSPLFLPFNLVALTFLYGLGAAGFSRVPRVLGETPEETLQIDLTLRYRSPLNWRTLHLPFYGRWTVWQAWDGPWTHHGELRHAYDFVIENEAGHTFDGAGMSLDDYYCYRRPVASPVRGLVAAVVDGLPDNEPGRVDVSRRWGNIVCIHDDRGFYVLLAHFAAASIKVSVGQRVEPGTVLGLCGNSGYSPQPHLHVQVQATAECGADTLPFRFVQYQEGDRLEPSELLSEGSRVEPLPVDTSLDQRFEFLLGDELAYDVWRGRDHVGELRGGVRMAVDGTLYLQSRGGGRLYFGKADGTFRFYRAEGGDPYLSLLLRALPRLPLVAQDRLRWTDCLPASVLTAGPARVALQLASALWPGAEKTRSELVFAGRDAVRCRTHALYWPLKEESAVIFDELKGPATVTIGDWRLTRAARFDDPPADA